MFIKQAWAATTETATDLQMSALADAPTPMESFMWNIGLIVAMVILFYVLLIMPQQRRFKDHKNMLNQLKKGDRIVTSGGLIGKIDHYINEREVVIDLGNNVKVTMLSSMIQDRAEAFLQNTPQKGNNSKS